MDKFAVVVPVYNEEKNVVKLANELDLLEIPYMFVDDGSRDKTLTTLWLKDITTLCYFPRRGKSFAIKLGAKALINEGYEWILILDGKKSIEDIKKLDSALLWHEEESKIFLTKSGIKLIHKDIFEQVQSKWFNAELKWKIYWLKWKVTKIF